jgi:uncharacterized protein (TIGR02145 family)
MEAYATNSAGTAYGNKVSFTTLPQPFTWGVSDIRDNSINLHGFVWPNNASALTVEFEYGTTNSYGQSVTAVQSPLIVGTYGDSVNAPITGLTENTKYHFRVKTISSPGAIYGKDRTFMTFNSLKATDIDGNSYTTVSIGTQVWMTENLKVTKFTDDTPIPLVADSSQWSSLTTPAFCWYGNDGTTNKNKFGALYNGFAVSAGNLCPTGWHVPDQNDFETLVEYVGGLEIAGYNLTEFEYTGCNSSGFSARMGGMRYEFGTFEWVSEYGYWWGFDLSGLLQLWVRPYDTFAYGPSNWSGAGTGYGMSVRCIKDK